MAAQEEIESISKVTLDSPSAVKGPSQIVERVAPNKEHFDRALGFEPKQQVLQSPAEAKASLLDEIRTLNRNVEQAHKANPEHLAQKAKDLVAQIDEIKSKLETPNLKIKGSVQRILRNKLDHIDESLKTALDKAGIEVKPLEKIDLSVNTPIERFLGMLTNGQEQLKTLGAEVQNYHLNGKDLSPATMLTVQIKVGQIQQEIELFSSLLNKALESVKTIMNIQV